MESIKYQYVLRQQTVKFMLFDEDSAASAARLNNFAVGSRENASSDSPGIDAGNDS